MLLPCVPTRHVKQPDPTTFCSYSCTQCCKLNHATPIPSLIHDVSLCLVDRAVLTTICSHTTHHTTFPTTLLRFLHKVLYTDPNHTIYLQYVQFRVFVAVSHPFAQLLTLRLISVFVGPSWFRGGPRRSEGGPGQVRGGPRRSEGCPG